MTTQPNCKYYFCFFSCCQNLNSRLKEFASKEQSWFKESQRLMEKIAECQKEQFEANERQEQLASANNRYFVILRLELDRLFLPKLM